jgi:translocation protein SEC66
MQFLTLSLLIPIAYVSILLGSMATFSHLYRSRQVNKKLRLAPYFPEHTTRNIYISLLHLSDSHSDSDSSNEKEKDKASKVPDSVLRAALLARACDDIRRIMEVRMRKPALAALLQRGVVGDEIFQRLQRAEQELELEIKDVVAEANALSGAPGTWGQTIFQSANEMVQNQMLREKLDAIKAGLGAEKERWERTRESARRELLGGVEGVASAAAPAPVSAATATPTPAPVPAGQSAIPKGAAGSSDEDGVIVETPAAEVATPATTGVSGGGGGGGGGKNKKKKGKK